MSENKSKPSWLKTRKTALKGAVVKLYNFPEGTTLVTFNPDMPPVSKPIEGKMKAIYTVTIEDSEEKFVPSKTLERKLIAEFEKDVWVLEITRRGLTIDDTVYTVAPHLSKKDILYSEQETKKASIVKKP
jgi:hypothetical protein